MYKCNAHKRINVCKKIIHLLSKEEVTFSEYPEIIEHLNVLIAAAKDDIEYPDYKHWYTNTKAITADDTIIEEW